MRIFPAPGIVLNLRTPYSSHLLIFVSVKVTEREGQVSIELLPKANRVPQGSFDEGISKSAVSRCTSRSSSVT